MGGFVRFAPLPSGGLETRLFTERTGLQISAVTRALEQAEQRGLIERSHTRIAPTAHGKLFLNDLLEMFL